MSIRQKQRDQRRKKRQQRKTSLPRKTSVDLDDLGDSIRAFLLKVLREQEWIAEWVEQSDEVLMVEDTGETIAFYGLPLDAFEQSMDIGTQQDFYRMQQHAGPGVKWVNFQDRVMPSYLCCFKPDELLPDEFGQVIEGPWGGEFQA